MSSGFVAAGASTEEKESDAWTKAREKVEATKQQKPARQGEQEGGKSLYEHLQAQKAAKQEAFEEATKLRNQFRALDDSEIEFLDTIQQRERQKEAERRHENEEQIDAFKKEQTAAEQAALEKALEEPKVSSTKGERDEWTTGSRKRRKVDLDEHSKGTVKLQKLSPTDSNLIKEKGRTVKPRQTGRDSEPTTAASDVEAGLPTESETSVVASDEMKHGLGLDVYNSDSDS